MRFRGMGFTALSLVLMAGAAQANGFSRGTADTDILYEPGNFNMRAGVTIVAPSQKTSKNPTVTGFGAGDDLVGQDYLGTYAIPSVGMKYGITDSLSCAVTYTDSFGADSDFGGLKKGAKGIVTEEFVVNEFGGTCAYFVPMGPGRLAVLGGAFVERFDYNLDAYPVTLGGSVPYNVQLEGNAYGWRAGLGYEIPDIALRAQLLYKSGTSHTPDGTFSVAGGLGGSGAATGIGELPQTVELRVQSGIAPGWLAFGSVLWTDWSVNETLQISAGGTTSENKYYWRDGWTVTGGVGHVFNDRMSGAVSLQWDRGVSTGYDLRTDKWVLGAGISLKDDLGGELRLGAAAAYLASGEVTEGSPLAGDDTGWAVDSGWAGILSAAYKVNW